MQNFHSKAAKKVEKMLREGVTDEERIKEFHYWLGYRNAEAGIADVRLFTENKNIAYNEFVEQYITGYEDAQADMEEDQLQKEVPF